MFSASPIQAFGSVRALGLAESGAPIRWTRSPPPWWPTTALRSASVTVRTEAARRKRGSKWGKVRVASSEPSGVTTCTSARLANAPATWRAIHPSSDLDSQWVANTTTTGRSGGAAIDDREVIPGAVSYTHLRAHETDSY